MGIRLGRSAVSRDGRDGVPRAALRCRQFVLGHPLCGCPAFVTPPVIDISKRLLLRVAPIRESPTFGPRASRAPTCPRGHLRIGIGAQLASQPQEPPPVQRAHKCFEGPTSRASCRCSTPSGASPCPSGAPKVGRPPTGLVGRTCLTHHPPPHRRPPLCPPPPAPQPRYLPCPAQSRMGTSSA